MIGNERGQGMIEYILIVVFVVVAGLVVWKAFGETVAKKVQAAEDRIEDVEAAKIGTKD